MLVLATRPRVIPVAIDGTRDAVRFERFGLRCFKRIAVSVGARVASSAAAGEVLVTSTVRDLVSGSGIEFAELGERELKGVPGTWNVYAAR